MKKKQLFILKEWEIENHLLFMNVNIYMKDYMTKKSIEIIIKNISKK
ncbi:hypothetical protein SASC598O11_012200 [Snodgrassella alvi SCGC AB-598-O11]|nr:hypothetical protein SASC598O11_012200 [Snodgrassella alvi SCGC AB-598-O11]